MKDFDHLLSVWQGQPKQVKLSVDDVLKQVKKGLGKLKTRLMLGAIAVVAVLVMIISMVLFLPVHGGLTYIGLIVWAASLMVLVIQQTGDYRIISTLDVTTDPATYLSHLKLYKKRRAHRNGRFFYYYALALSVGMLLYVNEFIQHSSTTFKVCFYVGWLLYMIFIVFYLKNRIIAQENNRVADLIERLENLKQQFE